MASKKCPYCNRKIPYFTALIERGNGEHVCPHCKKSANIIQRAGIWGLFTATVIVAAAVLLFYFAAAGPVRDANEASGSFPVLSILFFGKGWIIKWILWEFMPFIAFYLVSPIFWEAVAQKKHLGQTTGNIRLSDEADGEIKTDGSTRVMPVVTSSTGNDPSLIFEDISSSSEPTDPTAMSQTRSFTGLDSLRSESTPKEEEVTAIDPEKYTKVQSYSSDAPLSRIDRTQRIGSQADEADVPPAAPPQRKPPDKNYSGNRRF